YGYGDGDGVKSFAGQKVYCIDSVPTLIDSVHRTYAQGRILNNDLTFTPCYVARVGNSFAHGESLSKAHADAQTKELQNMPVEKKIERFINEHPDREKKYDAQDLFNWHGMLTGSCMMGREQFCKEHGINVKTDSFTVKEFIELTHTAYGGSVIEQLADTIELQLQTEYMNTKT
ncbi:MAG: hypothetical protein J5732_00915, partial [Bacteroidaceae bacterium]|nr:hypothetical protein [Bacteroidaceae bacterium]